MIGEKVRQIPICRVDIFCGEFFVENFQKCSTLYFALQSRVFLQSKKVKSSKICYSFMMSKKSLIGNALNKRGFLFLFNFNRLAVALVRRKNNSNYF